MTHPDWPDGPHGDAGYTAWPPPDGPRDGARNGAGPPPGDPTDHSPGTSGPGTSRRRRRRRGRSAYAAVAVAVMLLAVVVGLAVWAPWRKPPLLQPTGLAAGSRTTSSVAFHWSGPPSGPSPDKYLILHNGTVISSVPGTVTSFHSTGLIPGTAYQYRVAAVRAGQRSALSPALTVNTKSPPLSAARWQGRWTVNVKISAGAGALRGNGAKGWTEAWKASPTCPTGPCTVQLKGGLNRQTFQATLHRTGAVYTGTTTADVFRCGNQPATVPVKSKLTIRVAITKAQPLNRAWLAGAWTGQMEIASPYTSTSMFYCKAFKLTTSISASF